MYDKLYQWLCENISENVDTMTLLNNTCKTLFYNIFITNLCYILHVLQQY